MARFEPSENQLHQSMTHFATASSQFSKGTPKKWLHFELKMNEYKTKVIIDLLLGVSILIIVSFPKRDTFAFTSDLI